MKGTTIVFDALTVAPQASFAFDVWYANHYIPPLLASGRHLDVRLYGSPQRASYLAVFESDAAGGSEADRMPAPSHAAITGVERYLARSIGEQRAPQAPSTILDADILYPVLFPVPREREQEFNAWYDEEHLGILLQCRHWPLCRRFRIDDPAAGGPTHIALHYLTSLAALESDERTQARSTPWRARLAAESWFRGDYRVYYRYSQLR